MTSSVEERFIDFTTKEAGGFQLTRKLFALKKNNYAMCRAADALIMRIRHTLLLLSQYKQALADQPLLQEWQAQCPVFFEKVQLAVLPPGTTGSAAATRQTINEATILLKKDLLEIARTMLISAHHSTHGCTKGRDCLYCLSQ